VDSGFNLGFGFRGGSCNLSSFGERLKFLREKRGLTQPELAQNISVSIGSIQNFERGKVPLGETVAKLAITLGCSTDWLLLGESEDDRNRAGQQAIPHDQAEEAGLIMVPKVKARLNAGGGSLETSDEITGRYAFRSEWIRLKGRADRMVLMDVTGDSMEPEIRDRDVVLIDQSQADIIAGAVYAVGVDDVVLVKYLDKLPGKIVLRSANERYAPIEIDLRDESQAVRIIGRVVWWCREAR
jgi:phage repressor protein C with HTH and peptisase S24 domain